MTEIQNITDLNQDIVGEILLQITLIKKEKRARQDKETINGFFNWEYETCLSRDNKYMDYECIAPQSVMFYEDDLYGEYLIETGIWKPSQNTIPWLRRVYEDYKDNPWK